LLNLWDWHGCEFIMTFLSVCLLHLCLYFLFKLIYLSLVTELVIPLEIDSAGFYYEPITIKMVEYIIRLFSHLWLYLYFLISRNEKLIFLSVQQAFMNN